MNKRLENLINEIVKEIDDVIFESEYNTKTSDLEQEDIESNRDRLRDILEPLVDDSEFLAALKRVGVENWEEYEDAVAIYGKPIYE